MEMLVGEQKQDGVALLLDPAGRRSLISPFRISRKCRTCVEADAKVTDGIGPLSGRFTRGTRATTAGSCCYS
jgi:hypothetical protein